MVNFSSDYLLNLQDGFLDDLSDIFIIIQLKKWDLTKIEVSTDRKKFMKKFFKSRIYYHQIVYSVAFWTKPKHKRSA